MSSDSIKPRRVQGAFVDDEEIDRMIEAWTSPSQPSMGQATIDELIDDIVQEASAEPETQARLEASRDDHALRSTLRTAMDAEGSDEEETDTAVLDFDEPRADFAASSEAVVQMNAQDDTRFEEAAALAREHERVSASLLQRRLRIGLPRAERLIEQLEQAGIVAPAEGGPSRRVLQRAEHAVSVLD